jgi:hypothetical protein
MCYPHRHQVVLQQADDAWRAVLVGSILSKERKLVDHGLLIAHTPELLAIGSKEVTVCHGSSGSSGQRKVTPTG